MGNTRFDFLFFGLWIGLLLACSASFELYLEGQIYSDRTVKVVVIVFISGIVSSALAWRIFSRFGRSVAGKTIILGLGNSILFCLIGTLVSYGFILASHFFGPTGGYGYTGFVDFLIRTYYGLLGTVFSFTTFGLPVLWPMGVAAGLLGTFLFLYAAKLLNSLPHH